MQRTEQLALGATFALFALVRMRKMHSADRLSLLICSAGSGAIGTSLSKYKVVDLSQADDATWKAHHDTLPEKDRNALVQLWLSSRAATRTHEQVVTDLFNLFEYEQRDLKEPWVAPLIVRSIPEFHDLIDNPGVIVDVARACDSLQIDADTITKELSIVLSRDLFPEMMKNTEFDRTILKEKFVIEKSKLRREILWNYLNNLGAYSNWTFEDFCNTFPLSEIYQFDVELRKKIFSFLKKKNLPKELEKFLENLGVSPTAISDTITKLKNGEPVEMILKSA